MTANQLFAHIESVHNEENLLLPNDAIYLVRVNNLKGALGLIEEAMTKSGKDLKTVLKLAIQPNLAAINKMFPYVDAALDRIILDYGK